ncbi:sulfotransferase [Gammaproteobacteria bacterium]|nr:sulfotransferase [Gammaproteobacteria bacterium]
MVDSPEELARIQQSIIAKEFKDALKDLDSLVGQESPPPEALYMQAVCYRYTNQHQLALDSLDKLKQVCPDHGRAHQEEGHTYRALGQSQLALRSYERAFYYNPALEASLRAQLELLNSKEDSGRVERIQANLDRLSKTPKPLIGVMDLISQGKLLKAEDLCRKFMQKVPDHVEGMRLLADIGLRLGVLEDAEFLLESAAALEPTNTGVRIDYINALRKRQKYAKALVQAQNLTDSAPENLQFQSIFAIECMQSGDFEKAIERFDTILKKLPGDPVTLTSKGHALKTKGASEEAVSSYRDAIQSHRAHGEAYYSLANLKTYNFDDNEILSMRELVKDRNLSFMDRVYLNFSLGKALEDREDYRGSFKHYEQGNLLKKTQSRYDACQMGLELKAQKEFLNGSFFSEHKDVGYAAKDPIFILGLPRAGSTLLEQILSSHSQIDGTLELPNILSLAQRLRRLSIGGDTPGYPQILLDLDSKALEEYGKTFIEDTRIHRQGAPLFIDKMPNNFRHIGLIKLILPNAKIIDARRNPLDCCFSGFKQLFAEGQEFTYDLQDIGQYYRDYLDLMDHWDEMLPGFILRVNNEDIISDLEGEVRRMLNFCELGFEESCLLFHQTKRDVRTPSAEQVRQPVSRAGVNNWEPFEEFLSPLKEALGKEVLDNGIKC